MIPPPPGDVTSLLRHVFAFPEQGPTSEAERDVVASFASDPPGPRVAAVASIPAIATYDSASRVRTWGSGMTELLGWEPHEVTGRPAPVVSAVVRPCFESLLLATLDYDEISSTLMPLRTRTGRLLLARVTVARMEDAKDRRPYAIVGSTPLRRRSPAYEAPTADVGPAPAPGVVP